MSHQKSKYMVAKRNDLMEMRPRDMTFQEQRLLVVYLSKINPLDINTRRVVLPISEFQNILEINSKQGVNYYIDVAENLVSRTIRIPFEGGIKVFPLFKTALIYLKSSELENNEFDDVAHFSLEAHEDALPLMFEFKKNFTSYELGSITRLKSVNQLRMYEILKQYERAKFRIVSIDDLKELLGISKKDYAEYKFFKRDVLEVCRKALDQCTDISFTYEPHSKKGRKIYELKFKINKNKNYINPFKNTTILTENNLDLTTNSDFLVLDEKIVTSKISQQNFDEFWDVYPKRVKQKQAKLAWDKLDHSPELFIKIMNGLKVSKSSSQWVDDGGKFIPDPHNWIENEGWKDELEIIDSNPQKQRPTKSHNYEGRKWDYDKLLALERERLKNIK